MAEEETPAPSRITVSRDALRADLAEMELRLRLYFDEQLRHKADAGPFYELATKLDALDRGDFTDVHRRALVELIENHAVKQQATSWTKRERAMAVLSAVVAVAALMVTVVVAYLGGPPL